MGRLIHSIPAERIFAPKLGIWSMAISSGASSVTTRSACQAARVATSISRSRCQSAPKIEEPHFPGARVRPIWPWATLIASIPSGWVRLVRAGVCDVFFI